ncbi:CrcB-like protein-domain-containing protein [Aspergillus varians]
MRSIGSQQDGCPGGHHDGDRSTSAVNLSQLAAPSPVYDPLEKSLRQESYLENRQFKLRAESQSSLQGTANGPEQTPEAAPQEKHTQPTRRISKLLRTTYIVSYLVLFSIIGTLLRLVIECLTFYPGTPVNTSVLWANVGGSMVMGFLSEDQELFHFESVDSNIPGHVSDDPSQHAAHLKAHKKTVPLFIGLTTGFCGSLTSFSTFIRDVFLALSNNLAVPNGAYSDLSMFVSNPHGLRAPNGGFSFMALVAVLFTEIGLSLAGLFLGAQTAIALSRWTPSLPQVWLRKYLDPLSVILACLSWILILCLVTLLPPQHHRTAALWAPDMWRGPFLFSLVFAPVGCLCRFYISLQLNSRIVGFPLGTFMVNIGGTLILGMAYSIQHAGVDHFRLTIGGITGCEVLQGIMDGFCGCLTTVSTWVLELSDLRRRHAYLYGAASVVVALCFLVVEIGSLQWTRGLATPACFSPGE